MVLIIHHTLIIALLFEQTTYVDIAQCTLHIWSCTEFPKHCIPRRQCNWDRGSPWLNQEWCSISHHFHQNLIASSPKELLRAIKCQSLIARDCYFQNMGASTKKNSLNYFFIKEISIAMYNETTQHWSDIISRSTKVYMLMIRRSILLH